MTDRFHDQFSALLIGQSMPWSESDSTIIRLPLSTEYMKDGVESGLKRISLLFSKFMEHGSRTILFLNSVMQVTVISNISQAMTVISRFGSIERKSTSFFCFFSFYFFPGSILLEHIVPLQDSYFSCLANEFKSPFPPPPGGWKRKKLEQGIRALFSIA